MPTTIMAIDTDLLGTLDPNGSPILHFYDWKEPSLTYGYFTKPEDYLHLSKLSEYGIEMARRPTGGGIIFHLTDFAFSLLIPRNHPDFSDNTLENYAYVNRLIASAISQVSGISPVLMDHCAQECSNFCMSQPTQYDLIVNGKKVGGAAQRKTKRGYLHQGSVSLTLPPKDILRSVLRDENVLKAMEQNSYSLLEDLHLNEVKAARLVLRNAIQAVFLHL